jgi:hypothetical protein
VSGAMDDGLVSASVRLADVLARENAALAALNFAEAAAMLAEKQDAATLFALAWERARPLAASLDTRALTALAQRLDAAAIENRRLLERGIAVQRRVLEIVARAVPRALAARASPRYGARGTTKPAARTPLALSLRA